MRVIICGAGQVGYHIAAFLSREENDVTVIDNNVQLISQINDDLDVNGIVGHASNPDVLNAAGANEADILIAVTQSDEVNMVACQIGHSLFGVPKKIARIREQAYRQPAWSNLFSRAHMPIDVIISPESVIANDIYQRLAVPGTTYVATLAGGLAHLIGVVCNPDCPMIATPLGELRSLFPDLSFRVAAILRNNKPIIPDDTEQLQIGDEVYFVVDTRHLKRTMKAFSHEEQAAQRIIIAGGGNIGFGLAQMLMQKGRGVQIRMIEQSEQRARYLSEKLDDVLILQGSSLDRDILSEASIGNMDTFIAVTNDDESNILGSLLAKQQGCSRAITLVSNMIYSSLVGPLGVDAIVSPRSIIVSTIMQHVRRGRIRGLHSLREGFAEVIEAVVSDTSSIVNAPVAELDLSHEIIVAAIIRGEQVIMPTPDTVVKTEDHLIILATQAQAQSVEKMFSVQVDLF